MKKYIGAIITAVAVFAAVLCVMGFGKSVLQYSDANNEKSIPDTIEKIQTSDIDSIYFASVDEYIDYLISENESNVAIVNLNDSQSIEYYLPTNQLSDTELVSIEKTSNGTTFVYSLLRNPELIVDIHDTTIRAMLTTIIESEYRGLQSNPLILDAEIYVANMADAMAMSRCYTDLPEGVDVYYSGNVTARMQAEDKTYSTVIVGTQAVWIEIDEDGDDLICYAYFPNTLSDTEKRSLSSFTEYIVDVETVTE